MPKSHTRRLCSVLTAILLSLTVTTIAAPPATAVSYGECNRGWAMMVDNGRSRWRERRWRLRSHTLGPHRGVSFLLARTEYVRLLSR